MFSCEYCEIFKTAILRTPLVDASEDFRCYVKTMWLYQEQLCFWCINISDIIYSVTVCKNLYGKYRVYSVPAVFMKLSKFVAQFQEHSQKEIVKNFFILPYDLTNKINLLLRYPLASTFQLTTGLKHAVWKFNFRHKAEWTS